MSEELSPHAKHEKKDDILGSYTNDYIEKNYETKFSILLMSTQGFRQTKGVDMISLKIQIRSIFIIYIAFNIIGIS